MQHLISLALLCLCINICPAQHTWLGGLGNYNDPLNWDAGTVPSETDDVIIASGIVQIPENYLAKANNFSAENCTIDFKGSLSTSAKIEIYGDLTIENSTSINFELNSQSEWSLVGSNTSHNVNTHGIDIMRISLDESTSEIILNTELLASARISIKNGNLTSIGHDLETGLFSFGGACSPSCTTKNLHLENCILTCTVDYIAESNFGTATLTGNYTIKTPRFRGGRDIVYDKVELTNYDYFNGTPSLHNLASRDNIFESIIINNDFATSIAGDLQVNGAFTVIKPGKNIVINKESNGISTEWKLNGTVSLPPASGTCTQLTTFSKTSPVSSDFRFSTTTAGLTFQNAMIQSIKTSGGTFTIQDGAVTGFPEDWILNNTITGKNLYYIGGDGFWHDGNNWSETSGGAPLGCGPTVFDNVIFDDNSFTSNNQTVTVDASKSNFCSNFTWQSNPLNGGISNNYDPFTSPDQAMININGNLDLNAQVDIDLGVNGSIVLLGSGITSIQSVTPLPNIDFTSESATYEFASDLHANKFDHRAGTINTKGFDVTIDFGWFTFGSNTKSLLLQDSRLDIMGNGDFGQSFENMTIDAGTSYIACEGFEGNGDRFNIIELNNTVQSQFNSGGTYHKIILNGNQILVRNGDFTVDSLIINSDDASIILDQSSLYDYTVTSAILSNAPGVMPPSIESDNSNMVDLDIDVFNHCINGPIRWKNINVIAPGKINSPEGIDGGNTQGIDFTPLSTYNGSLYWIGGQEFWNTEANWSNRSGGCPANIDPGTADQLNFDMDSFIPGDTLFINAFNFAKELRWTNGGSKPVVYLGRRLVPDRVILDGGSFKLENNTDVESFGTLWIDEGLELKNGSEVELSNADIVVGRRPNTLSTSALKIDNTSHINGFGNLGVAGTASTPSIFTVDISSSSPSNFEDIHLQIVNPINGQTKRDLRFNLGGQRFGSLGTFASGDIKNYTFTNLSYFNSLEHNFGTIVLEDSAFLFVEN